MFSKKAIWSVVLLITLASLTLSIPDTALAAEPHIVFAASRARIQRGECSRLEWEVKGGFVVLLNDQQVPRQGHLEVQPRRQSQLIDSRCFERIARDDQHLAVGSFDGNDVFVQKDAGGELGEELF